MPPQSTSPSTRWPLFWVIAGMLALFALFQAFALGRRQYRVRQETLDQGRSEASRLAQRVDARLRSLEPMVQALAADLEAGRLAPAQLPARLREDLAKAPDAFRLGVAFAPDGKTLAAPFAVRDAQGIRSVRLEDSQDYTREEWFWEGMDQAGWGEPHAGGPDQGQVAGYSLRFRLPGSAAAGIARVELAMAALRPIFADNDLAGAGYGVLVSAKGVFMVHPRKDWVDERWTTFRADQALGDPVRWRAGEWALRGERGQGMGKSYAGSQAVWVFSEPVPASRWSVQAVVFQNGTLKQPVLLRRSLAALACTLLAMIACLALARLERGGPSYQGLWRCQLVISILLALGTGILWGLNLALPTPPGSEVQPIFNQEMLDVLGPGKGAPRFRVATGILVESLSLAANNALEVSGRVWQRYPPDFPKEEPKGFFFPGTGTAEIQEVLHRTDALGDLREFTFNASIHQVLANSYKYPFDEAVAHLRILPLEYLGQVALIPDFAAFTVLTPTALPGLAKNLDVPGWNLERSYFGLTEGDYDTNFGAGPGTGADPPRELSFNVGLSRRFLDPFLSAMLPVLVVTCLLYTLLLVFQPPPEGQTASVMLPGIDVLGGTATLLFPMIYAQINLREKISASGLVFLEYIYFVVYAVILLVAFHTLTSTARRALRIAGQPESHIARLVYWPGILGAFFILSFVSLY